MSMTVLLQRPTTMEIIGKKEVATIEDAKKIVRKYCKEVGLNFDMPSNTTILNVISMSARKDTFFRKQAGMDECNYFIWPLENHLKVIIFYNSDYE